MIYRTSRVVTTRLTTSKIICRYRGRAGAQEAVEAVTSASVGHRVEAGVTASPCACCVLGGSNEHDPPRPTIAPENDRDRRSLASISNRCPLFSRHHDWPSLDLTWRRRCVVAGGGACLRLECRHGAACEWRGSDSSAVSHL